MKGIDTIWKKNITINFKLNVAVKTYKNRGYSWRIWKQYKYYYKSNLSSAIPCNDIIACLIHFANVIFRSRCPDLYPGSLRMPIESTPWKFLLPSTRGRPREPCLVKMITSTSWGMIRTQLNLINNTITSLGENNIGIHVPETSEYYRTFASPVFRCS